MAVKVADTIKPMNDSFPAVEGADVEVVVGDKPKRLQKAIEDGDFAGGGGSSQKEELPPASAELLGKVYQFVGETGTYKKGAFYECVELDGAYTWKTIDVAGVISDNKKAKDTTYSSEHIEENFLGNEGEAGNTVVTFTLPEEAAEPESKEKLSVIVGKVIKWVKNLAAGLGDLTKLKTKEKASTVGAINELSDSLVDIESMIDNVYTTEEKVVGKWIDGKPIYRRVIKLNTTVYITSASRITIAKLNGTENVLVDHSNFIRVDGHSFNVCCYFDKTAKEIQLWAYRDISLINGGHMIIEYTKTTD